MSRTAVVALSVLVVLGVEGASGFMSRCWSGEELAAIMFVTFGCLVVRKAVIGF